MFEIDSKSVVVDIERSMRIMEDSMKKGIKVRANLAEEIKEIDNKLIAMEYEADVSYGIKNIRSVKQVLDALEKDLDAEQFESLNGKTDQEHLGYIEEYSKIPGLVRNYRALKNIGDKMKEIKRFSGSKNIIHPVISLQKSNRISYAEPGVMSIHKDRLWDILVPENNDYKIYTMDIKNQEPWIMVNMLNIKSVKDICRNKKLNLYSAIFFDIFSRVPNAEEREDAKIAWLAMSYGGNITNLGLRHIDSEAVGDYFNSVEEIAKYKKEMKSIARKGNQMVETYFGTDVYANKCGAGLYRSLMDLKIQGTAADILHILICKIQDTIDANGWGDICRIYLTRNDEIDFHIKNVSEHDSIFKAMLDIMNHKIDDWEPFEVECKCVY